MFVRSIVAAACILSLVACAGSEPSENTASEDQAATSVGPSCGASYAKANELYKEAVKTAKLHKTDACGGFTSEGDEGAYLTTIASFASRANATCGAFQNVIKTSPWAAPIREELAGNLALHVLTGDLDTKTWKGLESSLSQDVTMWGPAPGAYGNSNSITFHANGKATVGVQEWAENADMPVWKTSETTWSIGATSGDSIKLMIGTREYTLKAANWDGSPDFDLRETGSDQPGFTAYISECEA